MSEATVVSVRTYTSWYEMIKRCYNKKSSKYSRYGGRGIRVTPAWLKLSTFVADLGERPIGRTLGRVNNDGDYSRENCRWETSTQQANNKGVYRNNTSGIKGVAFLHEEKLWRAYGDRANARERLYFGKDFFEACCARKSWEIKNGRS